MLLLCLSLAALCAGPALVLFLSRAPRLAVGFDAFVVVALCGLVMLHIIPHSIATAGWPAVVTLMLGLLLPSLLHGAHDHCQPHRPPGVFLGLALGALGLHAMLDGVALVSTSSETTIDVPLALGVILHRMTEGMGVFWLTGAGARLGLRVGALAAVGTMTLLGFAAGHWAVAEGALVTMAALQAMIAGSLVHVIMRHAPTDARAQGHSHATRPAVGPRAISALGGALGLGLLMVLGAAEAPHASAEGHARHGAHAVHHEDGLALIAQMATRVAPAVLVALVLAALMHAWAPRWHSPTRRIGRIRAAWAGTLQGLLLAPCSCGVLPVYRQLRARHAPEAQSLAYLLAAPGLGLVTLMVSWALLGPWLTLARVTGAVVLAGGVAWAAPRSTAPATSCDVAAARPKGAPTGLTLPAKLEDGLRFAGGEVLDFVGPWLLFGLLMASLCQQSFLPAWFEGLGHYHLTVPVVAMLALPVYLCGSAGTLVAWVLLGKGLSTGGALALMWSASMLSPATLGALRREVGQQGALRTGAWLAAGIVLLGGVSDAWHVGATPAVLGAHPATWTVASGIVWLLLGLSVVRQGVREAVDQIVLPNRQGPLSPHHSSH